MGLRKLLSLENLFSVLCSKRRVISGLGAGFLASLLLLSLLFSVGSNNGAATVASSPSSLLSWFFSAPGSPVEQESASEEAHLENLIGNDTMEGSNPLEQGEGLGGSIDGNTTGTGNGTVPVKAGVLEKPSEENLFANLTDKGPGGEELPPGETHNTNLSMKGSTSSLSVMGTREKKANITNLLDGRSNGSLSSDSKAKGQSEVADGYQGSGPRMVRSGLQRKCDIFSGRWVRDESKPYYPPGSCPHIDGSFNCHENGRPDSEFLRWRWQPNDCDIPSLNATDFLKRLRGQRLIFVGDSLNRNMWESLICILRHSIKNKKRVYERSGRNQFKTEGYYSFIFKDYNCSIDFVRSPFLVREYTISVNGTEDEKLRLDVMDATTSAYLEADIVVFNTGHWWTHEKTSRGVDYYQEGEHVYPLLKAMEAYRRALLTWANWVDKNINPNKTQVVFRGYSLTHFSGGQWNSGGQCHKEMEPIFNESYVGKYPGKMKVLEQVLKQMKTPVIYLNISRLTDYRKDGHPSIYRKQYKSVEEQISAEKTQDCSHWCLPGVPDAWNELLYASLLMIGRGSWKK